MKKIIQNRSVGPGRRIFFVSVFSLMAGAVEQMGPALIKIENARNES
jgi:hypothetical protein